MKRINIPELRALHNPITKIIWIYWIESGMTVLVDDGMGDPDH